MSAPDPGPAPAPFATAPSLSAFLAPPAAYLASQGQASDKLVVATAVVVRRRMLLVQRSRADYGGLCWETPGGLCDDDNDGSVLAAAARELREEAGLAARRFAALVTATPHAWDDGGTRWRKLTFLVEVHGDGDDDDDDGGQREPAVRLDPAEHEDYVWASEREIRDGRAGGRVFTWISEVQRTVVLDAFALARRLEEEAGEGRGNGDANANAPP